MFGHFTAKRVANVHTALSMSEAQLLDTSKSANWCTVEVPAVEDRRRDYFT